MRDVSTVCISSLGIHTSSVSCMLMGPSSFPYTLFGFESFIEIVGLACTCELVLKGQNNYVSRFASLLVVLLRMLQALSCLFAFSCYSTSSVCHCRNLLTNQVSIKVFKYYYTNSLWYGC